MELADFWREEATALMDGLAERLPSENVYKIIDEYSRFTGRDPREAVAFAIAELSGMENAAKGDLSLMESSGSDVDFRYFDRLDELGKIEDAEMKHLAL